MGRLSVSDVFCYICRGILIEPVTLPCFHVFCFTCFEQSMQETSYSCPLCRKRISNWVRSAKKTNTLINEKLWTRIKKEYSNEVRLKLNGEDDGLDQHMQEEFPTFASTSKPGEVAQEFTKFLNDFRNEIDKLKEAEELASIQLIQKLKEEEEEQLKTVQEKNINLMKEDSELAMKIQKEINKELGSPKQTPVSKKHDKKLKHSAKKSNEKLSKGPMDNFIKGFYDSKSVKENNYTEEPAGRSTSADSTDSIRLEMNLFKPIQTAHTTPPKRYADGKYKEINLTKVTPLKLDFSNLEPSSSSIMEGKKIHSTYSAFVNTNVVSNETEEDFESPTKRLKLEEIETSILKDITLGKNSASSSKSSNKKVPNILKKSSKKLLVSPKKIETQDKSEKNFETQDYLNYDPSIEEDIIEEQKKIERIILQEKQDRELALKLSQEWESELNDKPQTRSMKAAAAVKSSKMSGKSQPTLMESIANRSRRRK